MIVFAAIVPHPPESIPGIGTVSDLKKIEKTISAFDRLREEIEQASPDTIVIISPHARLEPYSFVINSANSLSGSFVDFGFDEVCKFKNDVEIANKLAHACQRDELSARLRPEALDYGTLVPLFHLTKNIKPKIVHLSFSLMSYEQHFRYGQIIEKVIGKAQSKRIAIIASGDLSHRLFHGAPAGYSPKGEEFDRSIIHHLGENNLLSIMNMHKEDIAEVAECGIRSIIILMGALHEEKYSFKLFSYEGPFGVGNLVARLI
ncbi:MAG: hypothetical protein HGA61_00990 [Candidatus Moranbacteria bacterium]|nr:hypothetical protein [Candidatus Moranbacteria bacterium]